MEITLRPEQARVMGRRLSIGSDIILSIQDETYFRAYYFLQEGYAEAVTIPGVIMSPGYHGLVLTLRPKEILATLYTDGGMPTMIIYDGIPYDHTH